MFGPYGLLLSIEVFSSRFARLLSSLYSSIRFPVGLSSLPPTDLLFISHDRNRVFSKSRGQYKCFLFDPIFELARTHFKCRPLHLSTLGSSYVFYKSHNSPIPLSFIFLSSFINSLRITAAPQFFSLCFSNPSFLIFSQCKSTWRNILERTSPRLVLAIMPDESLCAACLELEIPVFDLQHGITGPHHHYYSTRLINRLSSSTSPSGFICTDRTSYNYLNSFLPHSIHTVMLPRPQYLDLDPCVCNRELSTLLDTDVVVLVSLGYPFDNPFPFLISQIKSDERVIFVLRPHPVQRLRAIEMLWIYIFVLFFRSLGGRCLLNLDSSLLQILRVSHIHVTVNSSVCHEASELSVPSVVLDPSVLNCSGAYSGAFNSIRDKLFSRHQFTALVRKAKNMSTRSLPLHSITKPYPHSLDNDTSCSSEINNSYTEASEKYVDFLSAFLLGL